MDAPSTVGEISRLTGVSVRTLHHYDEIGLVPAGERSESGYRLYGPAEVARLQEVLFFKELGLGLDEIKRMIEQSDYARASALRRQRTLLEAKAEHLIGMIEAIDHTLDAETKGTPMSNEDMLGVFGDFDPSEHEQEARERWGHSDAFKESTRRTAGYGVKDWQQMGRESDEIDLALVALMDAGVDPGAPEAMDLAERHRAHITKWFYECTYEIHTGLGQMYVTDPRFQERIDQAGEGLAAYLSEAIAANATR